MSILWSYLWPALAAGLLIGVIAGLIAFRRAKPMAVIAIGLVASLAAVIVWHGPLGGGQAFVARVEADAAATLVHYEMTQVRAKLQRGPLTRNLSLSGTADDFQSSELVRIMGNLPGVGRATWSNADRGLPLIAEAAVSAIVSCLVGMLLAYFVALRRRYNAQWKW